MKLHSVGRLPLGLLISLFLVPLGFGQAASRTSSVSSSSGEQEISYVGAYSADGKYQPVSKMAGWYNRDAVTVTKATARPAEVPPFVDLHSRERVIENVRPPLHATRSSKGKSFWAGVRDQVVTLAYGREQLLLGPHHVIADSAGRVIISDPTAAAVHVLDGENSFRIAAGPNRRLHVPSGIAIDGEDNIYIADSEQGVVVVYDRSGSFLRYIGKLGNDETLFHEPTGMAIDSRTRRLYVLDSERHLLFILDLMGREIRRVGRYSGNDLVVDFEFPTEIAIGQYELAIMDKAGSRIWITDFDGTPHTNFRFASSLRHGIVDELGLAIDANDRIYISNGLNRNIATFDSAGHLLGTFGHTGANVDDFQRPTGLWIDGRNHLFVADESMRRVQVFQLTSPPSPTLLAAGE